MIYTYRCSVCKADFVLSATFSNFRQEKDHPLCGGASYLVPSVPNAVLVGDGWTGKNIKIKGQMELKNRRLDRKSKNVPTDGLRLVPNVGGQEVESWREASHVASSMGKDTTGYDAMARKVGTK